MFPSNELESIIRSFNESIKKTENQEQLSTLNKTITTEVGNICKTDPQDNKTIKALREEVEKLKPSNTTETNQVRDVVAILRFFDTQYTLKRELFLWKQQSLLDLPQSTYDIKDLPDKMGLSKNRESGDKATDNKIRLLLHPDKNLQLPEYVKKVLALIYSDFIGSGDKKTNKDAQNTAEEALSAKVSSWKEDVEKFIEEGFTQDAWYKLTSGEKGAVNSSYKQTTRFTPSRSTLLGKAAADGNIDTVVQQLDAGSNINATFLSINNESPYLPMIELSVLQLAMLNRRYSVVELLLARGAETHFQQRENLNAIFYVTDIIVLKILFEHIISTDENYLTTIKELLERVDSKNNKTFFELVIIELSHGSIHIPVTSNFSSYRFNTMMKVDKSKIHDDEVRFLISLQRSLNLKVSEEILDTLLAPKKTLEPNPSSRLHYEDTKKALPALVNVKQELATEENDPEVDSLIKQHSTIERLTHALFIAKFTADIKNNNETTAATNSTRSSAGSRDAKRDIPVSLSPSISALVCPPTADGLSRPASPAAKAAACANDFTAQFPPGCANSEAPTSGSALSMTRSSDKAISSSAQPVKVQFFVKDGHLPLAHALIHGNIASAKALLAMGATLRDRNNLGLSVLADCLTFSLEEVVDYYYEISYQYEENFKLAIDFIDLGLNAWPTKYPNYWPMFWLNAFLESLFHVGYNRVESLVVKYYTSILSYLDQRENFAKAKKISDASNTYLALPDTFACFKSFIKTKNLFSWAKTMYKIDWRKDDNFASWLILLSKIELSNVYAALSNDVSTVKSPMTENESPTSVASSAATSDALVACNTSGTIVAANSNLSSDIALLAAMFLELLPKELSLLKTALKKQPDIFQLGFIAAYAKQLAYQIEEQERFVANNKPQSEIEACIQSLNSKMKEFSSEQEKFSWIPTFFGPSKSDKESACAKLLTFLRYAYAANLNSARIREILTDKNFPKNLGIMPQSEGRVAKELAQICLGHIQSTPMLSSVSDGRSIPQLK